MGPVLWQAAGDQGWPHICAARPGLLSRDAFCLLSAVRTHRRHRLYMAGHRQDSRMPWDTRRTVVVASCSCCRPTGPFQSRPCTARGRTQDRRSGDRLRRRPFVPVHAGEMSRRLPAPCDREICAKERSYAAVSTTCCGLTLQFNFARNWHRQGTRFKPKRPCCKPMLVQGLRQ